MSTPTPAQAAQQNNRTTDGKYASKTTAEAEVSLGAGAPAVTAQDCTGVKGRALAELVKAVRSGGDTTAASERVDELFPGAGADLAYRQMAAQGDLNVAYRFMRNADHADCRLCD